MRLKEIEARLVEIKEELNTRAAELTDEEITKLETCLLYTSPAHET